MRKKKWDEKKENRKQKGKRATSVSAFVCRRRSSDGARKFLANFKGMLHSICLVRLRGEKEPNEEAQYLPLPPCLSPAYPSVFGMKQRKTLKKIKALLRYHQTSQLQVAYKTGTAPRGASLASLLQDRQEHRDCRITLPTQITRRPRPSTPVLLLTNPGFAREKAMKNRTQAVDQKYKLGPCVGELRASCTPGPDGLTS